MSDRRKAYRFASRSQWQSCVLNRFELTRDDTLVSTARLGTRPTQVTSGRAVAVVAVDAHGSVYWRDDEGGRSALWWLDSPTQIGGPFEPDALLAVSPRWVVGSRSLWAFSATEVGRYGRAHLQREQTIQSAEAILDIASDGHDGLWLLVMAGDGRYALRKLDCAGRMRARLELPCQLGVPLQLACSGRGRRLLVLADQGRCLSVLRAEDARLERSLAVSTLTCAHAIADRLVSNGDARVALWQSSDAESSSAWSLVVLDGEGNPLDEPFGHHAGELPSALAQSPHDLAISADALWLATADGLFRLDTGDASTPREADSTLLTPALLSPESGTDRGWLRAELSVELLAGSVLEAQVASTDDEAVATEAARIAGDPSLGASKKQDAIWALLETSERQHYTFVGPSSEDVPLTVPLFETEARWLWLRLRMITPPGNDAPVLRELRVLYPNVSIADQLPSVFRGQRYDPTGFFRRLVGVLETTTQGLDARIQQLGRVLDPATASVPFLDYLARWLDLPWADELAEPIKRALLRRGSELLSLRGTRAGLVVLLECLLGPQASLRLSDLSVDHAPGRLGGGESSGPRLPLLLAGIPSRVAVVGSKARLGHTRVACADASYDPFQSIVPTVEVWLVCARSVESALRPLLPALLAQYLPVGVQSKLHWKTVANQLSVGSLLDGVVLDAEGAAALGEDSVLGRSVLAGGRRPLGGADLEIGFRLR